MSTISAKPPSAHQNPCGISTSDAEAIGIFRIHHSLGDRTSLMSLLLACSRQISHPDAVPSIPTPTDPNSGWFSSYSSGSWWWRLFMTVCMVFWLVWNTLVDIGYLFMKDTDTPLKTPAGAEFTPRRLVYRTVSLNDMKVIKNAMNLTINDIALGVTQAGLSLYLNRRYGEGKIDNGATQKKNNLPKKKIRLRSTLFMNRRPSSSGIQALADMMDNKREAKWGNSMDYMLLPLTVGIKDDPLEYVREAKATIDRKMAIYTFSIVDLLLKFLGIKGLMINFQSYVDKMTIVLSIDENSIPDPHKLLDDLQGSLQLIKKAVYAKGLVKKEEDMLQAVFT